jgi:hypothetical protein
MPQYHVTDPVSGRSVTLTGDSPPTEQELNEIFAKLPPEAKPQAAEPAPVPTGQRAEGATFGEKIGNAAKMLGNALPTVGGIVGGVTGGVQGAALGGAAGEGYNQIVQHATEIPGAIADVARNLVAEPKATIKGFIEGATGGAKDAAMEAGGQAAGQVVGNAAAAGAGKLSSWLMNRATTRVTAKLMQDFPGLNDTLIDNALTVSKGGYDKAFSMLMAAKDKARAALKLADQAGSNIPIELNADLGESLKTALLEHAVKSGKVASKGMEAGEALTVASKRLDPVTRELFGKIDAAATKGGALDLTPTQADLLKTQLQKESRALYANRGAPNGPKAMGMDATERAEFASRLNDAIDGLASGYKSANAEARPLIGAVRGIKQAIRPNGNLYQAMVRPAVGAVVGEETGRHEGGTAGAVVGGLAGMAATSPVMLSREAIILAHPAVKALVRQLPKAIAQKVVDLLAGGLETSPEGQR